MGDDRSLLFCSQEITVVTQKNQQNLSYMRDHVQIPGKECGVSDGKSSLYFSHEITQQSTKLKGCGRFLLRGFVSGRVRVMFVCVVLFVCLLDSI